ncbi:MAG: hypothetical protein JWR16_2224 [Nevskia sp.]|nr:hypothetical protein [Nevskia sp.]
MSHSVSLSRPAASWSSCNEAQQGVQADVAEKPATRLNLGVGPLGESELNIHAIVLTGLVFLPCAQTAADSPGAVVRGGTNSLLKSVGAEEDQYIDVRGSWLPATSYESPRIPSQNATTISCGRASSECLESQATVTQIGSGAPLLSALTVKYQIVSWEEDVVVAKRINPRGVPINCLLQLTPSQGLAILECTESSDNNYFRPAKQTYTIVAKERYNVPGQWPAVTPPRDK